MARRDLDELMQRHAAGDRIAQSEASLVENPEDASALRSLSRLLMHAGRWEEALVRIQKATHLDPNSGDGWFFLGNALSHQERRVEAVQAYRRALLLNPQDADAWYNLGVDLRELGDLDGCIEAFQKTAEIQPMAADAWNNLALAFNRRGDTEPAMEAAFRLRKMDIDKSNRLIKTILGMKWK